MVAVPSSATRVGVAMHRGVITCAAECSGLDVARTMAAHRIHSVVLTSPELPPRLVTDTDLVRALRDGTLATSRAADLAREAPILTRDDTLACAVECLHQYQGTHAVVVDDRRTFRPVGVLSVLDLAEVMVKEANR